MLFSTMEVPVPFTETFRTVELSVVIDAEYANTDLELNEKSKQMALSAIKTNTNKNLFVLFFTFLPYTFCILMYNLALLLLYSGYE